MLIEANAEVKLAMLRAQAKEIEHYSTLEVETKKRDAALEYQKSLILFFFFFFFFNKK